MPDSPPSETTPATGSASGGTGIVTALLGRAILVAAGGLVLLSIGKPFWGLRMQAPQYPKGLRVVAFVDHIEGDVRELDGLNHYIGMKSLNDAAQLERRIARPGLYVMGALLLLIAVLPWRRWSILFGLPAIAFPAIFAYRLHAIMTDYGLNLDPAAPLKNTVKPFVPPLAGEQQVANFKVVTAFEQGFEMTLLAAVLTVAGLYLLAQGRRSGSASGGPKAAALLLAACLAGAAGADTLRVGPGRAFADVASAVAASVDGDTIVVEGGVHPGGLVVDRSVRLLGEGGAVFDGGGIGIVVHLAAPDIEMTGFTVRGSGKHLSAEEAGILVTAPRARVVGNRLEDVLFGIYLRQASGSVVGGNRLFGADLPVPRRGDLIRVWYSHDTTVEGNEADGGRDVVLWFSKRLVVRDNVFRRGRYGLHFMYCDDATVEANRLEHNSVGAFLMYSHDLRLFHNRIVGNRGASGYGVGFKDMDDARLSENVVADNRAGLFIENSTGVVESNLFALNDIGILVLPSARGNRFTGNSFVENVEAVSVEGASDRSANLWLGNYWSDYRGYDADGDGVGDTPHVPQDVFEGLTDRHPALRIFAGGPSAEAIDYAALLFPVFAPRSKLVDESPRIEPFVPPVEADPPVGSGPWAGASALLLLAPLCLFCAVGFGVRCRRPAPTAAAPAPAEAQASTAAAAVSVRGLTKRFGKVRAVDDVSFEIAPGETVVLWGPNGAGKTTLLHCLLGLTGFDGSADVLGLDARRRSRSIRARVGHLSQDLRFHADLTVAETVRFYARLRRVAIGRGTELVEEWDLLSAVGRRVGDLSGGMRQRLGLVIALLSDPPVLFLDEPTSNLDPAARREFGDLLARLKAAGKTLLFCSHRADEVWRLADRVVALDKGRVVRVGPPGEVLDAGGVRLTLSADAARRAIDLLAREGIAFETDRPRPEAGA